MRAIPTSLIVAAVVAAHAATSADQAGYSNPVLPGDYPDPSIVRVGSDYWATATTSQWAPIFPILHSRDLVNWTQSGAVFDTPPSWSAGSYWAPEISHDGSRFFVYYTARKKDGPLCVAVATALKATGPYTDHGPLVCQDAGSIDGAPIRDENGRRHLVWKEDGNSRKQPTPIWAQRLSANGTALEGEPKELLRNRADWEAHLIEGPYLLKRDGWFYMFYSADACCGRSCDYKLGVARAKQLLGPWERNPANPILGGNSRWQCPGHGSVVETPDGRDFLLYHAYRTIGFQFIGRQGVLDAITWTADGWPTINNGEGPSEKAPAPLAATPSKSDPADVVDDFLGPRLRTGWQWPWDQPPDASIVATSLVLRTSGRDATSAVDAIVARQARVPDYTAGARIAKPAAGVMAGLSAYGDGANALGASLTSDSLVVWIREKNVQRIVATVPLAVKTFVDVRMVVTGAERYSFQFSVDGADWQKAGDDTDGAFLPPWDRAVRVALVVGGPSGAEGRFDSFRITPR
jgi:xylan 1,4-beta-xylosidase